MNNSISPLDGRYSSDIVDLIPYFSEMALMRYRLEIEIEYLIKLSNEKAIKELRPISNKQKKELQKIYLGFDVKDAKRIKNIEQTAQDNCWQFCRVNLENAKKAGKSKGKSGSFFFFSKDRKFIMKTIF